MREYRIQIEMLKGIKERQLERARNARELCILIDELDELDEQLRSIS